MRLARVLGAIGRSLITLGTLILLFVAYQLWGTGIRESQAQDRLKDEFADLQATDSSAPPTTVPKVPIPSVPPDDGVAVAHIVIPKLGVDKIVVQGIALSDLKKGPGHYPDTPLPGECTLTGPGTCSGNAAIAGHRTTYGAPFNRIDELDAGDLIRITTRAGTYRYEVIDDEGDGNGWKAIRPTQVEVLQDFGDNRLTLTSCHPKYSARQRIVVVAKLTDEPVPHAPPKGTPTKIDGGLDGTGASAWPAIAFGAACALVWLAAWLVGRRWRKWPSYLIGALPFFVLLFYFFENFARLLPANY
jgi:sortase A